MADDCWGPKPDRTYDQLKGEKPKFTAYARQMIAQVFLTGQAMEGLNDREIWSVAEGAMAEVALKMEELAEKARKGN